MEGAEAFNRGISSDMGGGWDSQDDDGLFDVSDRVPSASQSLASVTPDRSLEMISGRRSRVSSQENGKAGTYVLDLLSEVVFVLVVFFYNGVPCV